MLRHAITSTSLAALLLIGCGGDKAPAVAAAPAAVPATVAKAEPDPQDPCRLLEAKEAEAALGAPLAGAPFRSSAANRSDAGTPEAGGDTCWYETADFRNLAVQLIWTNAGAVVAGIGGYLAKVDEVSKGLVKLQDGSELTGEWDEVRVLGCCTFVALRGDTAVEIDFGGSSASFEQVGALADAALRRLEAPLPIDGNDGIAAAEMRRSLRPKAGDPCSLWDAADIEATIGTLKGKPEASGDDCTYTYEADNGRSNLFVSTVTWRNGYRRHRESNQLLGSMLGAALKDIGAGDSKVGKTKTLDGPWDAAQQSAVEFNTVRRDVQIAIRQRGMSQDELRALLGRAYDKIEHKEKATP
ncbi:MAG: hypothetical protein Q8Q73_02455 [Stagnimonas sp.]|nr:hypothetical protein [Stagnimonas sp.]